MKFLKKEDGFTLVELMVVVAIIGILSAVAIPNFKKYQAKSKTSEAKLQLSSIYSAETAIQTDYDSFATCLGNAGYVSPNGTWDTTEPTQGSNYYAVGFSGTNTVANGNVTDNGGVCNDSQYGIPAFKKVGGERALTASLSSVDTSAKTMGGATPSTSGTTVTSLFITDFFVSSAFAQEAGGGASGAGVSVPGVDDAGGYFIAGAIGVLDTSKKDLDAAPGSSTAVDMWAIDQDKQLYQINIGY